MVVLGVIAAVLLVATLVATAVAPARVSRARRERVDHDLVAACLENAEQLARVSGARLLPAARPYAAAWPRRSPARRSA